MTGPSLAAASARENARNKTDGRFGEQAKTDPGNSLLGAEAPLFVFDKNRRKDYTQVEPYWDTYQAIYTEMQAAGQYPYNDSFKGRIPGLAGSDHEDHGIYMLQSLRSIRHDQALVDQFLADGGSFVDDLDLPEGVEVRGTLARHGWYMNGDGYADLGPVRLHRRGNDWFFKEPGQRVGRRFFGGKLLFKPDTKAGKVNR